MKVLLTGLSVFLIFLMSIAINAQACGYAFIYIRLTNAEKEPIKEAKIELFDETPSEDAHIKSDYTKLTWLDGKQQYLISHGMCGQHFNEGLRISAKGFQSLERRIDLKFGVQSFEVKLKRVGTDEAEQFQIVVPRKPVVVEPVKPFDADLYKDWQRFEERRFSLYLPKEFKLEKWNGIDTNGWRYKSPNFLFSIASGSAMYEGPLESDKKLPGYRERLVSIDNVTVRIWFYEDKRQEGPFASYPYVGQVTFKDPFYKGNRYAIVLWSKDSNGLELAEKIFESITIPLPK